jgi:hypothetical protein
MNNDYRDFFAAKNGFGDSFTHNSLGYQNGTFGPLVREGSSGFDTGSMTLLDKLKNSYIPTMSPMANAATVGEARPRIENVAQYMMSLAGNGIDKLGSMERGATEDILGKDGMYGTASKIMSMLDPAKNAEADEQSGFDVKLKSKDVAQPDSTSNSNLASKIRALKIIGDKSYTVWGTEKGTSKDYTTGRDAYMKAAQLEPDQDKSEALLRAAKRWQTEYNALQELNKNRVAQEPK